MSHAISRAPIQVCSVGQNCLAEAYVNQLLRTDPIIRVLNLKQYAQCSPSRRRGMIFIIDQCGLELSLYECLKQLRGQCSDPKFLVLDRHKSKEEIVRILILGAHGYVPHADAAGTLVRAVNCIAANQLWVPSDALPEFLREVSCVLRKDAHARRTTTPREEEILELVRRRLSNPEIADLLQIRVSTVKFHLSNILSKLNANNRRELTQATSQSLWKMKWSAATSQK